MALNIVSNFAASIAQRNLATNDAMATNSIAKLSSGSRVNSAKDDAAALAIGTRLRTEVEALRQASVNAGQATSMLQIADGALGTVTDIMVRMKSLAVQASSGQLSSTERTFLDNEFTALRSEINRIATDTEFNGTKLISGGIANTATSPGVSLSVSNGVTALTFGSSAPITSTNSAAPDVFTVSYFTDAAGGGNRFVLSDATSAAQVLLVAGGAPTAGQTRDFFFSDFDFTLTIGATFNTAASINATNTVGGFATAGNSLAFDFKVGTGNVAAEDNIVVTLNSSTTAALEVAVAGYATAALTTAGGAGSATTLVSSAIDEIATYRSNIGTSQNRLEFAAANIAAATENAEAARSSLMDLNVATEITRFTSQQILVQAGVSALAQANQLPQNLLRLFQ